jgi:phospholipase C
MSSIVRCVISAAGLTAALSACGGGGSSGGASPGGGGRTPPPRVTPSPPATPTPVPVTSPTPNGKIAHVVIIVQENRSFDNLFAGFPGADSATSGPTHTGQIVQLQPWALEAPGNLGHERPDFDIEYANGQLNGFDLAQVIGTGLPANFAYSFVPHSDPQSEAGPYWTLAQRYTLADHLFQSNSSGSFTAHQYLIAAQSQNVVQSPDSVPWGCDAPAGTTTEIGTPSGLAPGPFPCFGYATLGQELDTRSVAWKYYVPSIASGDGGGLLWSAYDAIFAVRHGPDWSRSVSSPETNVLSDVTSGKLPAVSWVVPSFANSDHPFNQSATGPAWVGSIVNAIGKSKYWNSTAIFILWDDWGGWYDNVAPPLQPQNYVGPGFRVPLIVVSPYAKHGYVSHVPYLYGSIVSFAEWAFGLPSLGAEDATAQPLFDCFDFTQTPPPYVPLALRRGASYFLSAPPDHRLPDER